jgi:hypothetical protein
VVVTQPIADLVQDAMHSAVDEFAKRGGLVVTSISADGHSIVVEGWGHPTGPVEVVIDDYQPPTVTPVCPRCGDAVHVRGSRADCHTCMVAFAVGDDGALYPRFSWR